MKSSKMINSVLIGTPVFLAGCGCTTTPIVTQPVVAADGVPVVATPMAGYHYSPFYSGFVPIFIPIGGMGYGNTYQTYYNRQPAADRDRYNYARPTTNGRASAAPISTTSRPSSSVTNSNTAKPTSSPASHSSTVRGIAGSTGLGSASS